MTLTERADRLEQLRVELSQAVRAQAVHNSHAAEGYALAAEHQPCTSGHTCWTAYAVRSGRQAIAWRRRAAELEAEIAALERVPAAFAAPASVSAAQCAAVDDTHNFRAVAA